MARTQREQHLKDLKASFDAIKNNYFWIEYTKQIQRQHDVALTIVRSKADGAEPELRVAAALCSAFHTVLSLPSRMMGGDVDTGRTAQEDTEGNPDDERSDE